jgi:hypothetical protein
MVWYYYLNYTNTFFDHITFYKQKDTPEERYYGQHGTAIANNTTDISIVAFLKDFKNTIVDGLIYEKSEFIGEYATSWDIFRCLTDGYVSKARINYDLTELTTATKPIKWCKVLNEFDNAIYLDTFQQQEIDFEIGEKIASEFRANIKTLDGTPSEYMLHSYGLLTEQNDEINIPLHNLYNVGESPNTSNEVIDAFPDYRKLYYKDTLSNQYYGIHDKIQIDLGDLGLSGELSLSPGNDTPPNGYFPPNKNIIKSDFDLYAKYRYGDDIKLGVGWCAIAAKENAFGNRFQAFIKGKVNISELRPKHLGEAVIVDLNSYLSNGAYLNPPYSNYTYLTNIETDYTTNQSDVVLWSRGR